MLLPLKTWANLSKPHTDALILGNGASVAVNACFSYPSLYHQAKTANLVTPDLQKIFDHLKTEDFELVLSVLWHARHVNRALSITEPRTEQAYKDIQKALIEVVRNVHPIHSTALRHLKPIYEFMHGFQTVVSLSYDLLIYWAMIEGNSKGGFGTHFKDGWTQAGSFDPNWRRLRTPMTSTGATGATLVFYPHGNLSLCAALNGSISKLVRTQSKELLDVIFAEWQSGQRRPMFVCEGLSDEKFQSIQRQGFYTNLVFNEVLDELERNITIYGWNIADNDAHILQKICGGKTQNIAVSVYTRDSAGNVKQPAEIQAMCDEIRLKINVVNSAIQIEFFNAESPGCWNHP